MLLRKIRNPGIPDGRRSHNLGRRDKVDEARKAIRVEVIAALAEWPHPITAVEVWRLVGAPAGKLVLLGDVLDELTRQGRVEVFHHLRKPGGPLTRNYELVEGDYP